MPVPRQQFGDMYIQVEVETPKNLTRRQRELLVEFEKESQAETSPEFGGLLHAREGVLRGQGLLRHAPVTRVPGGAGTTRKRFEVVRI